MKSAKHGSRIAALLLLNVLGLLPSPLFAHDVRPAYLGITEVYEDVYNIVWKQARTESRALRLKPILPTTCTLSSPESVELVTGAFIRRSQYQCPQGAFRRNPIVIDGLSATLTDVWIEVNRLDNDKTVAMLANASNPSIWIEQQRGSGFANYIWLGMRHLILGIDHILLIVGLMLFVGNFAALVKIITAFTIAHSFSLALSTLNIVQLSAAPVEAAIALSVLFLAVEASSPDKATTLTARAPFAVAFCCGLLHGLGFAGAFSEIGLPADHIVKALLLFNVGLEFGQLLLIAVILSLARFRARLGKVPVYLIGSVASFLLWQRLALLV